MSKISATYELKTNNSGEAEAVTPHLHSWVLYGIKFTNPTDLTKHLAEHAILSAYVRTSIHPAHRVGGFPNVTDKLVFQWRATASNVLTEELLHPGIRFTFNSGSQVISPNHFENFVPDNVRFQVTVSPGETGVKNRRILATVYLTDLTGSSTPRGIMPKGFRC